MQVTVKYDGPAVAEGRMDARDLAPAMLATARLFEHSAALLYGSDTALKIEVQADFRGGSFSYDILTHVVELGRTIASNLSVSDVIATGTLLFVAVREARGRKTKEIVRRDNSASIVFHDGDNITVNLHVAQLFLNPTIREDIEGAVQPLKNEGVTEFRLTAPTEEAVVPRDAIDYFNAPAGEDQLLQDDVVTDVIEVLSPHFKEGNKWQFSLAGEGPFWARILDKKFVDRVRRHLVVFGTGDALRVKMRVRISRKPNGDFERLREIIEVVDEIKYVPPPSLFDE